MPEKEVFEYSYRVPVHSEVKRIREQYLPKEMTKMDQLCALDAGVTKRGNVISLAHGIVMR